uniref:Ribosomal protein L34 n=1 Tax=Cliftonaea pectinata TaxID=2007206 RepID=A0A1Z1MQY1_9FLOR|nr:ribosomal protein L34 [Cliftonaea pectinata]ARW68175.1 ribosomal protein L34 [Cliftonaea pectinata]
MSKGTKLKKVRKSGFLKRMKRKNGRKIIQAKRNKKRVKISI